MINTPPALQAHNVYRFFRAGDEETLALRGVSLQVRSGEIIAVTGPSGSGKSTLLACLAGLDEPDGGSVWLGDKRLSHQPEAERAALRRRNIGVLFQTSNLLTHLNIENNIAFVQRLSTGAAATPRDILAKVGLGARRKAYASQLSGGETARAGLAVAIANNPSVLLADEPTGELDNATEHRLLQLLRARADHGCAVLVVTHSPAVVAHADRVLALRDGQVRQ
jgi:putative ABC transport system ATP-binding protein